MGFPSLFIMDALDSLTDHQRSVLEQYQVGEMPRPHGLLG